MLRQKGYLYKQYNYYFLSWEYLLGYYCSKGQVEYAIQQANLMKKEATALKFQKGINCSLLILGTALMSARRYNEAICQYKALTKISDLDIETEFLVYIQLADAAYQMKQYKLALNYINTEKI
jgi:hypothetical protein